MAQDLKGFKSLQVLNSWVCILLTIDRIDICVNKTHFWVHSVEQKGVKVSAAEEATQRQDLFDFSPKTFPYFGGSFQIFNR